jgi:hypothetical protein
MSQSKVYMHAPCKVGDVNHIQDHRFEGPCQQTSSDPSALIKTVSTPMTFYQDVELGMPICRYTYF